VHIKTPMAANCQKTPSRLWCGRFTATKAAANETGDGNVKSHSKSFQIKGEAPLDFTTTHLDSVEVAKALLGRKLRLVSRHSFLNVGLHAHLHVEAQFFLDLGRDFVRVLPGVKKPHCGIDWGDCF
jgi:hypothetical protein